MTKEELNNWIKSAKIISYINDSVDGCGNEEVTKIFWKDGKLYAVDFMNGHPNNLWINNKYDFTKMAEPREVIEKIRIVEQKYYEDLQGEEIY